MKRHSMIASFLSCLLLITTAVQPIYAVEQSPSDSAIAVDSSSTPSENSHSFPDPLYEALYNCIDRGESLVTYECSAKLSDEYLSKLTHSMFEAYPEFFYLDHISMSCTVTSNSDGSIRKVVYEFSPIYMLAEDKLSAAKAEWNANISAILSNVPSDMTDLEKALILHDYLCVNFRYDTTLEICDSFTFLAEKTGVCEAYAKTYGALLDRLDIPNTYAISSEMQHMWNIIQIDGEWYHVDVTWDDPTKDQPGRALHTYFLLSDEAMKARKHPSWEADIACTSTKYDQTVLGDVGTALATDGENFYGISKTQKTICRYDLEAMTNELVTDLSAYRWYVWGDSTSYWNACYTNLYCDGEWLYYSTPHTVEALSLSSGETRQVCAYPEDDGYFYAMRHENGRLVCTVGTEPGVIGSEFSHGTDHDYQTSANGILKQTVCNDCSDAKHSISPLDGEAIAVSASLRQTPDLAGYHDIRIVLALDLDAVYSLGKIDYVLELLSADGTVQTLSLHSQNDHFDDFLIYDQLAANGKLYTTDEDHLLLGFIASAVEDESWNELTFTIRQASDQETLYSGSLDYAQLAAA